MASASTMSVDAGSRSRAYYAEILLASFASLLLEISYTRVISFKLFYYYTYFVIGLALLGIGTGGVLVTISGRLRRAATDTILIWSLLLGAASVGVGYIIVAYASLDTFAIWHYGTWDSVQNLALLVVISLALFASFIAVGVIIATLFGRRPEQINRLYFADLVGAGLACAVVVSLIGSIGPPATIFLAGLILALAGLRIAARRHFRVLPVAAVLTVLLATGFVAPGLLPAQRLETSKLAQRGAKIMYSSWSPIFRVDVAQATPDVRFLYHDGLIGSGILRWNGDVSTLGRYRFDTDIRAFPFAVAGIPPRNELIVGAAGGHEVLTSLYFDAGHIDAIELNPVTYSLVTDKFADYDGHLAENPKVNYVRADGRSFLARSNDKYNLIWYPAPDSYSATNASTAGAFVLSESYLYTSDAIVNSLEHLGRDGILAAQFGEFDYERKPNRTTRYVATARHALGERGIADPTGHILVATSPNAFVGGKVLSTILVKATPFTPAEVDRFVAKLDAVTGSTLRYAPGRPDTGDPVSKVIKSTRAELAAFYASNPYDVRPITDDGPFFWHFARFGNVLSNFAHPINSTDFEDSVGERVLLLLLLVAIVLAAAFLLLPFVAIRDTWARLPHKGRSAIYFAAIGLGFFFFEITLIQRLILFLGYPTYSLTVTLMAILIFTGIGALLSGRLKQRPSRVLTLLLTAITVLTAFYLFGLPPMTHALLGLPLAARVPIAFMVLAPLGICLGMFMPLGLGAVAALSEFPREYVAWGWAVNGFASVIGSVLTTILAMTFGFRVVLFLALIIYMIALAALRGLLLETTRTATAA